LKEWEVEFTDEFRAWWDGLTEAEQVDVRRPHVDSVASSKHANMKECVFSTGEDPTACCSPSTHGALQFC